MPFEPWRDCLREAFAYRELAPWQWMDDTAISVFIDDSGKPWFACVLGDGGEVFGLALYRGEEGFESMRALRPERAQRDIRRLVDPGHP